MPQLRLRYTGEDVILTKEQLEALGIRPGDEFTYTIRPIAEAEEASARAEIESILTELARAAPGAAKDSERELRKLLDQLKPGD